MLPQSPVWGLYERLVAEVPRDGRVANCVVGLVWTLVETDAGGLGMSLTFPEGLDESLLPGSIAGAPLREAASWLESWNYYEAAVGCATVNACTNTASRLQAVTGRLPGDLRGGGRNIFERLAERFAGGRVAVVGGFPTLAPLRAACRLTVLERDPAAGDLPDPACEVVLPEQDCVCITATALVNKTLPRLLELCRDAYTVLIGPTLPLSPIWFEYGVDLLAGTVVDDCGLARRAAQEGAHRRLFVSGVTKVEIDSGDVVRGAPGSIGG
jgi:uncharacterized protein (DUF4213/DUF364 family)